MKNRIIKQLTLSILISLSIWSAPSHSEECMASTDVHALMTTHPDLQDEKLIAADGNYSATLKNGDIILAKFATCDPGMSAHYFSVETLNDIELNKRVEMFLTRVLDSEVIIKKVIPQLNGLKSSNFKQGITLEGLGDQHQLIVKPSVSPLFKQHIQYKWLPPEH